MVRWLQIDRFVLLRQDEQARGKENRRIINLCLFLHRSGGSLFSSAVLFWRGSYW